MRFGMLSYYGFYTVMRRPVSDLYNSYFQSKRYKLEIGVLYFRKAVFC
jgi:hypothetical protein